MHSFEPRPQYFYPNASSLVAGDTLLGIGGLTIDAPLDVVEVEKNPAQVRVMLQDSTGAQFWVTLVPTHEVSLKPPF